MIRVILQVMLQHLPTHAHTRTYSAKERVQYTQFRFNVHSIIRFFRCYFRVENS